MITREKAVFLLNELKESVISTVEDCTESSNMKYIKEDVENTLSEMIEDIRSGVHDS